MQVRTYHPIIKLPYLIPLLLLLVLGACQKEERISYNEHIRPIFNKNCLACHGGVKKSGGFSLLFPEEAFADTESGKKAIVPGKANKSELFKRIVHENPELRMPLEEHPLSENEIELIRKWIDQGAKWEEHWAYLPIQPNPVPTLSSDWIENEIDPFILAKLEAEQLQPEDKATPAILARRVSMDLIGLPPQKEWVAPYLENPSTENYSALVDSLLASPHFGERWAALWLDLARYADSKGYEKDPYRNIWRYRDWVIQALNEDMPFDQFTIEQIAGDLLPNPTEDQLIATAFHRNSMTNTEGGTEDEEFRVVAVMDRLNTSYEVWMGTTMACVQCHSHPYDPIRMEEFYQSFALFNNTKDNDLDGEWPTLPLFNQQETEEINDIIQYIKALSPDQPIDPDASIQQQVQQALFPRLLPVDCNDIENMVISGNGMMSNTSNNLNTAKDKDFYFKYAQIPLDGLQAINFHYGSIGKDGKVVIHLDDKDGPIIGSLNFPTTGKDPNAVWLKGDEYTRIQLDLAPQQGIHDLVFEVINTTDTYPDGIVNFKEITLIYAQDQPIHSKIKQHQDKLIALRKSANRVPIQQEKTPGFNREHNVFERGNYLVKGDQVVPGIPGIFTGFPTNDAPRMAFAKWLVSKDNPLTARVMVNRFWEQLFGIGMIETAEDFGTQGYKASHPELLDYLALQFQEELNWSIKSLLRKLVLSATYQQSSRISPEKREKDPYNRLLARGPRFRLTAEQIRDQTLAVSGLLYDTIGGKSVMPPQPDGIWAAVYSGEKWLTSAGKHKFRRGLYTYWRRTTPYPSMLAFDSPTREVCVSRRIRTNTPLQALVNLNDEIYVTSAKALADKMYSLGKGDITQSIREGYELAFLEPPDAATQTILADLYKKAAYELQDKNPRAIPISFSNTTDEIRIEDPMAVVANAILNLDRFITKE